MSAARGAPTEVITGPDALTERLPVPAAVDAAVEAPRPRVGLIIGLLVATAFVMIFNETVLNVALRALTIDLGVSTTTVQWLTSGILLAMAVVIPTTGYLLERFTPRQAFLISITLFSVGTLIAALAPGFTVLLVGRLVQACGTGMMLPMLFMISMRLVPLERRGTTMGAITIMIAIAPAVGPAIAGTILEYLGWRAMFWVVLPLALVALVAGAAWMRVPATTRSVPLDVVSVLLSIVGFGGLVYGLSSVGAPAGEHPLPAWIPVAAGVVALGAFVARQLYLQRTDRALLDLRPFTRPAFAVAIMLTLPMFMCLVGVPAILLLYLESVLGVNAIVSGLVVMPGGLLLAALSLPVGSLFDRYGARPLVLPGTIAMAVALWWFALLGRGTPVFEVVGVNVVFMGGLGLMMAPLMTESMVVLPEELHSHGSAILSTLQQVAGAMGTAVFVSVAAFASAGLGSGPTPTPDATGLRAGFMVAGCIGVLAVVAAMFLRGRGALRAREY
jgi:MFS transporter, DHA2 family, lincomycin resistance protein